MDSAPKSHTFMRPIFSKWMCRDCKGIISESYSLVLKWWYMQVFIYDGIIPIVDSLACEYDC
jgi:hypothetical protein